MNDPATAVTLLRLVPIGVGEAEAGRVVQTQSAGAAIDGNLVMLVLREDMSIDDGPVDSRHARDIRPGDVIHWISSISEPHRVIWVAQQPVAPLPRDSGQEVSA